MTKEERKEYWKNYYEIHKEERKNYYEIHKEERKKYHKKYREDHKNELKDKHKNYYESHKDKIKKTQKKYYENHKNELKDQGKTYYETHKEKMNNQSKKYYNKTKNYLINIYQVYKYFERNYSRFISLENYITIMKMNDYSSKLSIMIRLGKGLIDENEAVALSGIILSDEEKEELKNIFNNLDIKRK